MNKKVMKIMNVLMIVTMLAVAASPLVFAGQIDPGAVTPQYGGETSGIQGIGQRVLGILTNVGIIIAVLVVAGLGIKYITGSAEEKAEYKKSFVPLLVGMILLLGASAITKFIVSMAQGTTRS